MGVSLGYTSTGPVSQAGLSQLLALADAANQAYDWWCESIWISETPDDSGNAIGSTKLFRVIDPEEVDMYMASLDLSEIVRFLTSAAERVGIEWRLTMAGTPFGVVTKSGPDATLQNNLSEFLEIFPADFDALRARSRADILAEWADQ